jgi:UDP:flavonoid glycosyltransferase YjiC (YdhE family)
MNVILVALGSHGDVHPFVGIGMELLRRGHRVKVIAYSHFEQLIADAGLELVSCGTAEEFKRIASDPRAWKRFGGMQTILAFVAMLIEPIYRLIAQNHVEGETVVAASSLALGARVAQDHLKITTASVHLQPSMLFSAIDPPYLQGTFMPRWMPAWGKRAQYSLAEILVLDRILAPTLNAFRKELGLEPVNRIFGRYAHSPQRVIGMFPRWFAPPAPDWPSQVRLTGFPLFDERGITKLSDDLLRFLDEGDPPIAFTPGSAMWQGHRFFEESARACALLGRRGLLLTRHLDHLPKTLPSGVRHVDFAPFSELLPRCAALVHHGGIGTSSQALAAGIPQLVVPHAHDQPDNAARLGRLGVARTLEAARYRQRKIVPMLRELLENSEVRDRCAKTAKRFSNVNAISDTCDLLEQLSPKSATVSAPAV